MADGYPRGFGGLTMVMQDVGVPVPGLPGVTEPPRGLIFPGATTTFGVIQPGTSHTPPIYGYTVQQTSAPNPAQQAQIDAINQAAAAAAAPIEIETDGALGAIDFSGGKRLAHVTWSGVDALVLNTALGTIVGQYYTLVIKNGGIDNTIDVSGDWYGYPYASPPDSGGYHVTVWYAYGPRLIQVGYNSYVP